LETIKTVHADLFRRRKQLSSVCKLLRQYFPSSARHLGECVDASSVAPKSHAVCMDRAISLARDFSMMWDWADGVK
jgi:hypothetical protein